MPPTRAGRSLRLIANPAAASGRAQGPALREAAGVFAAAGWTVSLRQTEAPGHARVLAAEAAAEGLDAVIAAGGDGTVHEIVNGLVGSVTALGVLPAGTGNVLAAQLGLIGIPTPLHRGDLVAAAEALADAPIRSVDTGRLNCEGAPERHFLLWAGIGLDAQVALDLENEQRVLKQRLGAAAFGILGLKQALTGPGIAAEIRCDGQRLAGPLILAVVANIPLYGGALVLNPRAAMDDGRLDTSLFFRRGRWSFLRHLGAVVTRRPDFDADWRQRPARRITIEAEQAIPVHADAEPCGTTPLSIEIRPASLRLLLPASVPAGLVTAPGGAEEEPR